MKTLFLILLLGSPCMAAGPKHTFSDPILNDELTNVYFDQANTFKKTIPSATFTAINVSTITAVSSATITNLTVSGVFTYAGTLGKIVKITEVTTTTNFATSNTVLQDTNLNTTYTMATSTNKVLVCAFAVGVIANAGNTMSGTIVVNSIDQCGATTPCLTVGSTISTFSTAMCKSVTPASASALVYKIDVASSTGGQTVTYGNGQTQVMELVEYVP